MWLLIKHFPRSCAALAGLAAGMAAFAPASAALARDNGAIDTAVRSFLQQANADQSYQVSVTINTPTARMPPCRDPQPFFPGEGRRTVGRLTVGVRCPRNRPATRYIQADVHATGQYFVASHDIDSGSRLTAGDIMAKRGDITERLDRLARRRSAIIGQQARRRIGKSMPIVKNMLAPPDVISRGDDVKVVSKGPGFTVTTHGKALGNATADQQVRVRTDNGTVVSGTADGPGVVTVSP